MFFNSFSELLDMGGYGFYVWLSYGISFVAILWLTIQSYREKNAILREVKRDQAREQRLQNNQKGAVL